jgi:hypothetical protein
VKKHCLSALVEINRLTFNHLTFSKDLRMFPLDLSIVGFKDNLLVNVNPKYLNSFTD